MSPRMTFERISTITVGLDLMMAVSVLKEREQTLLKATTCNLSQQYFCTSAGEAL